MDEIYELIEVEKIKDEAYNVRGQTDDEAFMELVRSVGALGILQPIIVQSDGEGFNVVAGHRRFAAARYQKMEKVPCKIIDRKGGQAWDISFAENLVRLDLTPIETAAAVNDCLSSGNFTIESIAKVMNRSETWIMQQVEICKWPTEVQGAVHLGYLSTAAAGNLARIEDETQRKMLTDYAVENGATARITAAWLQAYRAGITTEDPDKIEAAPGCPAQPDIQPHTPCVICSTMLRMTDLRYLPVCPGCQESVIVGIREEMKQRGGSGG